ncbi:hypothetical protein [Mycolicibacterium austroafricanum]|nr:hypothetical protein [Mycolicibacterium austroafricanum]QRZ08175.1 hypothetical protein JN090_06470 [Mycolicibacterium austroafricanum]
MAMIMAASSVVFTLTSCSSDAEAMNVTCNEWATADSGDQDAIQGALLDAHDLERYAVGNNVGLFASLLEFCGDPNLAKEKGSARKNGTQPINNAVDWDALERSGKWPDAY